MAEQARKSCTELVPHNHIPGSVWTVDQLHDYLFRVLDALEALNVERFRAQNAARDALDQRITQRFVDSDKAVTAALAAAEKAVQAALMAAKEAVTKAEVAYDKRFEAGNEIKQAMATQASEFVRRADVDQRFITMSEKADGQHTSNSERITRLEKFQSEQVGAMGRGETNKNANMWLIGTAIAVLGVVISVIVAVAAVYALFKH